MMKILIFIFCIFVSVKGFAIGGTGDVSGGGHGVFIDGKIVLLDFYEALNNQEPCFLTNIEMSKKWFSAIQASSLNPELRVDVQLLAQKFSDLEAVDSILAIAAFEALQTYKWSLVDSELVLLPLDTILQLDSVRQIAIRKGRTIYINRKYWNLMSARQQVGLVFHEIISSLLPSIPAGRERQILAYFFDLNFLKLSAESQNMLIQSVLPTKQSLFKKYAAKLFEQNSFMQLPIPEVIRWRMGDQYEGQKIQFSPIYSTTYKYIDYRGLGYKSEHLDAQNFYMGQNVQLPRCLKSNICKFEGLFEDWHYFVLKINFDELIDLTQSQPKLKVDLDLHKYRRIMPSQSDGCYSVHHCSMANKSISVQVLRLWLRDFLY